MSVADAHLHHGAVDEPHQTKLFGDRNEVRGGNDLARRIGHAQQGLVEGRLSGLGIDHRLEGQAEPVLAQAAHDFGGAVGIEAALEARCAEGL